MTNVIMHNIARYYNKYRCFQSVLMATMLTPQRPPSHPPAPSKPYSPPPRPPTIKTSGELCEQVYGCVTAFAYWDRNTVPFRPSPRSSLLSLAYRRGFFHWLFRGDSHWLN